MVERLDEIAESDAIEITPEAQKTIAALADGALRDAISILDQARSAFPPPITHDNVLSLVGVVRDQFLQQVASALIEGDIAGLLQLIDQLVMAGRDLARFVTDLAQHLRNLLVCQVATDDRLLVRVNSEALSDMKQLAGQVSSDRLIVLIRGLSALLSDLRWASDGRTALEIGMIRLMDEMPVRMKTAPAVSVQQAPAVSVQQVPEAVPVQKTQNDSPAVKTVARQDSAAAVIRPEPAEPPLPEAPPEDTSWTDDPISGPGLVTRPAAETAASTSETAASTAETVAAASDAAKTADAAIKDIAGLWASVLANLQDMGHMTLYLFSRPARPVLCQDTLQLVFAAEENVHYHEVNQASALKVLKEAVRRLSGQDLVITPVLAGQDALPACPDANEGNWVEKVRKTAQSLGIPMEVEE
jgi:DNA polymerase III gamma/tau subunit